MSGKHYYPKIKDVFLKPGDKVLMDYGEVTVRSITHDDRGYDDFTFLDSEDLVCRVGDMLVKYLDQEDIESLGFELIESDESGFNDFEKIFNNGVHRLVYNPSHFVIIRVGKINMFAGTIKNKSELERVLEMIGYEQQETKEV